MKKILPLIFLLTSMSANAEYIIHFNKNNIKIPEPSCTNPENAENGYYNDYCDISGTYYLIDGIRFLISSSIPLEGYECPTGKNYANHFQAQKLAEISGQSIYTPYRSTMPTKMNYDNYTFDYVVGVANYIKPDQSQDKARMYTKLTSQHSNNYFTVSLGSYYQLRTGTQKSQNAWARWYDWSSKNTLRPAFRACTI